MKLRIILIAAMLVMLAAPALACPPMSWVDKVNWQKANNYTEVNASCWMDGQGNLYNATFESHVDQNNILGYKYGDFCEWYTYQLDGRTIISGCENLDQKHRDHEMMNSGPISFGLLGNSLCGMLPCLGFIVIIGLVGLAIPFLNRGPVPPGRNGQ